MNVREKHARAGFPVSSEREPKEGSVSNDRSMGNRLDERGGSRGPELRW